MSNRHRSFKAALNEDLKFELDDGSCGTIRLYTMGIGDLTFRIFWKGYNPIDVYWRLDGYGLAPSSGNISCESIDPEKAYYFEKNKYKYTLYHTESFHWTAPEANANGIEIFVKPK